MDNRIELFSIILGEIIEIVKLPEQGCTSEEYKIMIFLKEAKYVPGC
jgi:hypothetical protein